MLLKDFSFSQVISDASLELGETVYTGSEDSITIMGSCNNPGQWSCSHYSPPGSSCNRPQQSSCSHYTSLDEQKVVMVAA